MKILKIRAAYIFQQIFSFLSEKRKLKIIKHNSFLMKKLEISTIDYKNYFINQKIAKYNYTYIYNFWIHFKNDFKYINEKENDLYNIFLKAMARKDDFYLKLSDKKFNSLIKNLDFKENVKIKIENLDKHSFEGNKLLLIKNNQLTEKIIKKLEEIFDLFSTNKKMSKEELLEFINIVYEEENDAIYNLFLMNLDLVGFLQFEDFLNLFYELLKNNSEDFVWNCLYRLGYNNILEINEEYDLDYLKNHLNEFEKINPILFNFLHTIDKKINKMSIGSKVDKIFFEYLNKNQIFQNLKVIEISFSDFKIFLDLNLVCQNLEELILHLTEDLNDDLNDDFDNINNKENEDLNENEEKSQTDFGNKMKQLFVIFPNILCLKIILIKKFDLFEVLKNLINSKVEILEIFLRQKENINSKFKSNIILPVKNLKINGNFEMILPLISYINFINLERYEINMNVNCIKQEMNYYQNEEINKNDVNIVNEFLSNILNKKTFSLKNLFVLFNSMKSIKNLKINFMGFSFGYNKIKEVNNYFEFKIYDKNKFKEVFVDYDFTIDEKEVSKYKKINIEGLNKLFQFNIKKENDFLFKYNQIEEIIENKDVNLCDINLSLYQKKYYIKSLKDVRLIYCEDENQLINFFNISKIQNMINNNEFQNLKYLNLTIDNNQEFSNEENLSKNRIFYNLSKLIKNSTKLKSLILRLHPYNYEEKVYFILSLIENLNQLKILKISLNCEEPKIRNLNEEILLEKYPKIKERRYYFKEFNINDNYIKCIFKIDIKQLNKNVKLLNYSQQDYENISIIENQNEEMRKLFEIFVNGEKINFCFDYQFGNIGKTNVKIRFKKPLTNLSNIFSNCSSLISLNFSNFNSYYITNMSGMFNRCINLTSLNFSNFNSINVINMRNMFINCSSLISLDLSNFNTQNVINMSSMFNKCCSLMNLNLSNFNTKNVVNMSYMFYECISLKSLDLSHFNTEKVNDMSGMFSYCSSLKNLNLSCFNTRNVQDMSYMFCDCSSLITLNLANFNTKNVNDIGSIFSGLNENCNVITLDYQLLKELSNIITN